MGDSTIAIRMEDTDNKEDLGHYPFVSVVERAHTGGYEKKLSCGSTPKPLLRKPKSKSCVHGTGFVHFIGPDRLTRPHGITVLHHISCLIGLSRY